MRRLSVVSALRELYELEQKHGSLWRGMRRRPSRRPESRRSLFLSLRGGMGELIARLEKSLDDVTIHRGLCVTGLSRDPEGYRIEAPGFEGLFQAVILATPAGSAGRLAAGFSEGAAEALEQIPYTRTRVVYLAYRRSEFSHPLDGFGFVVPREEARVLDACTWVSSKFEDRSPAERVLLRCSVSDGRHPREGLPDEGLVEKVHGELRKVLGISCSPVFSRVLQVRGGMAQPSLGHDERLQRIQGALSVHPGLAVAGAYSGGVGIPDCIGSARRAVGKALAELSSRGPGTGPRSVI